MAVKYKKNRDVTNMEKTAGQRFWEIDIFRGLALVLMIIYHLLYDLNEFYSVDIAYYEAPYYYIGKTAAVLFILVAGVSAAFSRNNTIRGLKLVAWGLVIFLVMYVVVPGSNIVFGILQFLGVCLLIYPVFKNISPYILAAAGTAIILAGEFTYRLTVSHNWFVPLGFGGPDFYSVDYFPLVPWLGVFLWGVAIKKTVYRHNKGYIEEANRYLKPLAAVGRHTLVVYLLHQPLLMATLYLIFSITTA